MNSSIPPKTGPKSDPLVGCVVSGKFKVESLVAAGGMGKIYRAEQIPLGRLVALKVLHAHASGTNADDPQFKKRFLREASILARLQHPNIVTVFDYGAVEGVGESAGDERYFMAMEYLSGETLSRRINERGALSARDTIHVARQLARGLTEAHAQGVIHRDLKPSNVMMVQGKGGEEQVKIVDFGIVKIIGEESSEAEELTQEGSFIGSPKYMAPEQIQRGGKVDVRTDVYSFGIILYQCLCGSVPFDGASSIQTLMAHLNQAPQPLRQRAPGLEIPEWLERLAMACIEKDPERRPQGMDRVARALAEGEMGPTSGGRVTGTGESGEAHAPTLRAASGGSLREIHAAASAPNRVSGITEQGTIASVPPSEEGDKTRTSPGTVKSAKGPLRLALVAVALVAVGAVAFVGTRRAPPPPAASAPAPAAAREFVMTIDSAPPGAEVREAERVLGTTPLQLTIDNDGARLEARRFVISKDGYLPYSLVQGPSLDPVRVTAPLAPAPAASAPSPAPSLAASSPPAPVAHGGAPHRPSPAAKASAAATSNNLDIRLTR